MPISAPVSANSAARSLGVRRVDIDEPDKRHIAGGERRLDVRLAHGAATNEHGSKHATSSPTTPAFAEGLSDVSAETLAP